MLVQWFFFRPEITGRNDVITLNTGSKDNLLNLTALIVVTHGIVIVLVFNAGIVDIY